jgi:DNA-binding transcriptional ArsR family regulator
LRSTSGSRARSSSTWTASATTPSPSRGRTGTAPAKPFEISLNAVSKHLKLLERARLLRREVRGRNHYCSLDATPLGEAALWADGYHEFWERRLDALEALVVARRRARARGKRRR